MATGVVLEKLRKMLRNELRMGTDPALSPETDDPLNQAIRAARDELAEEYEWPHLTVRRSLTLQAAQRYYTEPSGIDWDRLDKAWTVWQGVNTPLQRGIPDEWYNVPIPADPPLAWDRLNVNGTNSIEIFPTPIANGQTVVFTGSKPLSRLTMDADTCELDEWAVVWWAASLKAPEKEKAGFQALAQRRMATLRRNRSRGPDTVVMGLGDHRAVRPLLVIRPRYQAP